MSDPGMLSTEIGISNIEVHPGRMRHLRPEVVEELAASIRHEGLLQPIIVRPANAEGLFEVLAGRHRLAAVKMLGQDTIRAEIREGLDAAAAELIEIDENLIRADLSPAERSLHLARRKVLYEAAYPQTRPTKAGGPGRGKTHRKNRDDIVVRFTKDAATKTGKSERLIQREIERATRIVDLSDAIGTTLDTPDELDALVKLPQPVQRDLIERAKAGKPVTAKHLAKRLHREGRERDLAAATEAASSALGKKLYGVIYADPPWRFELWSESGKDKVADNHYPTMTADAIGALPVPAADNCALFLWATTPMLPQCLGVMRSWGFEYKTALVWLKDRAGTGYWTRGICEFLLIGTRGNIPAPTLGDQPPQLLEAPRGRHSEKPTIFAEKIERLFPNVAKLEMFARTARPGWDMWGNEAPTMTEVAETAQ